MRVWAFAIFFVPLLAAGQPEKSLSYYVTLYCQADGKLAPSIDPVISFAEKLESKRASFKSEKAFVHFLFTRANQQFFREFDEYATFRDLISRGRYNCLGGTALYALLLQQFGIGFSIVETSHHICILVDTDRGRVLLESTDGAGGFVDNEDAVRKRLAEYREMEIGKASHSAHHFRYGNSAVDTVTLTGVLGLLHYNQAVQAYNRQDYKSAITRLHHALLLHRSARMEEFLELMITTVRYDEKLNGSLRDQFLTRLTNLRVRKQSVLRATLMIPLIR